jgi:hypothetical protein
MDRDRDGDLPLGQANAFAGTVRSIDEMTALAGVAGWAIDQIGPDDARRNALRGLEYYLSPPGKTIPIPYLSRISSQKLELLAPFINQCIEQRGMLSPAAADCGDASDSSAIQSAAWTGAMTDEERDQERLRLLSGFKARMVTEGKWPPAGASISARQTEGSPVHQTVSSGGNHDHQAST